MSTFIINLNDTVALSDSTLIELVKVANSCQPCIQEAETNCNDFKIVVVICVAFVFVALIAKCAFLSWKDKIIEAEEKERNYKKTKEEEEAKRKQKSDLTEKLLDFLKSKASENNDNNGQQAKNQCPSMTVDDIYSLLKDNASKSCAEQLRQRYVELCVEVLQKLKTVDKRPGGGSNGTPTDVSNTKKQSDIYIDVLCFLIAHVDKNKLDEQDLSELRKSCGLETGNPIPD